MSVSVLAPSPLKHPYRRSVTFALLAGLYAFGCGGEEGTPQDRLAASLNPPVNLRPADGLGPVGSAGAGGVAGSSNEGASGGSQSQPAGGAGGASSTPPAPVVDGDCQVGALPFQCVATAAPASGTLIDFATYVVDGGNWGVQAAGLTGGSSFYQGNAASALTTSVEGGQLRLQASIAASDYTGVVLWFGPCVDASMYSGLELAMGGDLAGATMQFRVQTHDNYPISVGNTNKGACAFESCDTRWDTECLFNLMRLTEVPEAPTAQVYAWDAFTGGRPSATMTPGQLVGLQLHFECGAEPCELDLTLGNVRLAP